jgi:hypothetical protein
MELATPSRIIGFLCIAVILLSASPDRNVFSSESATDCGTASETLLAGFQAQPEDALALFLDALQTNPGCRRSLLVSGMETFSADPEKIEQLIFIARQEFPEDQTLFAEAALETAPEHFDVIRNAFMADTEVMQSPVESETETALVELPPEAQALDEDLREAIARMTAKVEGKYWPEQELEGDPLRFKGRDDVRIPKTSRNADESSLENSIPIDTTDERAISTSQLRINDHWEKEMTLRLDESKFVPEERGDSRAMQEARKREISPAGAVGFPRRPVLRRPSYYIPPAAGDYRSTIDLDNEARQKLIIRPSAAFRTVPGDGE